MIIKTANVNIQTGEIEYNDIEVEEVTPLAITKEQIKEEARKRIQETGLSWYVEREVSGGSPIPEAIKTYCAEVRSVSNDLEALDPIPTDYADDNYWPERIIVSEEN